MSRPDALGDRGPAYTREELLLVGTGFPDRGLRCHKSRTYIPVFADLSVAGETRVRALIRQGRHIMAIAELRAETGFDSALTAERIGMAFGPTRELASDNGISRRTVRLAPYRRSRRPPRSRLRSNPKNREPPTFRTGVQDGGADGT